MAVRKKIQATEAAMEAALESGKSHDHSKHGADATSYLHRDLDAINLVRAKLSIVKRAARLEDTDPAGLTPLHLAALHGQSSVVVELLEQGADPCVQGLQTPGNTPLHLAAAGGSEPCVRAFKDFVFEQARSAMVGPAADAAAQEQWHKLLSHANAAGKMPADLASPSLPASFHGLLEYIKVGKKTTAVEEGGGGDGGGGGGGETSAESLGESLPMAFGM